MRYIILTLILIVNLYLLWTNSIFHEFASRVIGSVLPKSQNDLDRNFTPIDTILQANYPGETHEVITEDGYILTIYRIRGPAGSVPVYLQHGLVESAADWLTQGKGRALAYILADEGYDVWLGNARGNTYSNKHRTLNTTDAKFWDFSWEELAMYDLPAVINYITELNKNSLFYVGHSMGATTFSVMAVERPDVAKKIKAAFALAPSTYIHEIRSPIRVLSHVWKQFQSTAGLLGINQFFSRSQFIDNLSYYFCESTMLNGICTNSLFLIGGFSYKQHDDSLVPKIWRYFPAGTSIKLFTHWLQQMTDNKLRKFDYGPEMNLKLYDSATPPQYDLSKINVPVAVFWSENDWLIGTKDAQQFYDEVPVKIGSYKVEEEGFNHCDFLFGVDAHKLVYSKMISIMAEFNDRVSET